MKKEILFFFLTYRGRRSVARPYQVILSVGVGVGVGYQKSFLTVEASSPAY